MNESMLATRGDLAQQAREHYEQIALQATHWNSVIPKAIDAWERLPELEADLRAKQERINEQGRAWDYLLSEYEKMGELLMLYVRASKAWKRAAKKWRGKNGRNA